MKLKVTMILSDKNVSVDLFTLLIDAFKDKTSIVIYNRTLLSKDINTVHLFDVEEQNSKIILVGYVENIEKNILPFTKMHLNLKTLEIS